MSNFSKVKEALQYIDDHLDEPMSFETLAAMFHFSPYYFHRMFSIIVGKTIAVHIRDRRLLRACSQLSASELSILNIALDCGYNSAQAFSRAFKESYGLPPSAYRKQKLEPVVITIEELIMKFTNRLKGGILLNPTIIKQGAIMIAGRKGDGNDTGGVWSAFETLNSEKPIPNKLSDNGYEIRVYDGSVCTVHVGLCVSCKPVDPSYDVIELPPSTYACFDVYVANGYDSQNNAMNEWLETNQEGYAEKLLGDAHYCIEYYDERFHGSESGSIVEIWIPIEKK